MCCLARDFVLFEKSERLARSLRPPWHQRCAGNLVAVVVRRRGEFLTEDGLVNAEEDQLLAFETVPNSIDGYVQRGALRHGKEAGVLPTISIAET